MAEPCPISNETPRAGRIAPSENLTQLLTDLSRVKDEMERGQICALNQNRESLLGLRVTAGDFPLASLLDWMTTLTPNSTTGIWMVPFRGIPAEQVRAPMDLLYLDAECRVIAAVEFFPTYRVSPSSQPAASVLALPTHSIFSSHTQPGDQLVLCPADEMQWRLERMARSGTMEGAFSTQGAAGRGPVLVRDEPKAAARPALVREMPKRAADPDQEGTPAPPVEQAVVQAVVQAPVVLEEPKPAPVVAEAAAIPVAQYYVVQSQPRTQAPITQESSGDDKAGNEKQALEKPWMGASRQPAKSGLARLGSWLFAAPPDPRKASRIPVEGVVAHFFTGGAPQAHEIRDVSPTGLYLVTTERWYPGTVIRMTLTKPDTGQAPSERSMTVQAKAVRWGNDGVGMEFVLAARQSKRGAPPQTDTVDSVQLGQFLGRILKPGR